MKKILVNLCILLLFAALVGCSSVSRSYKINQGTGDISTEQAKKGTPPTYTVNVMVLRLDADVKSETRQSSKADLDAALAQAGAQAANAIDGILKGLTNKATFDPPVDNINNNSENRNEGEASSNEPGDDQKSSDRPDWKFSRQVKMQSIYHDGRPFYRLGQPGESFGKLILIVGDSDKKEFTVPDTMLDTGDMTQQYFFNGKGHTEHTFDGNASLFWFKGGSETVTIYFNGP